MNLAPIVFFAYKRPEHARKSLESLSQNENAESSELFIYCDAPKRPEDAEAVRQVREVVRSKKWCGKVHIIEYEQNVGCANSIIYGVTKTCEQYGNVIVIEDDLVLSPYFLNYMNSALNLYKDEESVMQISGYMFPVKLETLETDAFFLPLISSWGWATWQRAWKHFDPDMTGYEKLKSNKNHKYKFNLNDSYPYFDMLEEQLNGQIDAWCIRWYLSTFILNGLTIYPKNSLVLNIGFDGSGTHCGVFSSFDTEIHQDKILSMPAKIQVDDEMANIVFDYLHDLRDQPSLLKRISQKIVKSFVFYFANLNI
jgi:hypothetical protein